MSLQELMWNKWDEYISMPSQQQKFIDSKSALWAPYYINRHTFEGVFEQNGEVFTCSLEYNICLCGDHEDFNNTTYSEDLNVLPCKFMYRLASELDLIDEDGKRKLFTPGAIMSDDEAAEKFVSCVPLVEALSDDQQYDLYCICLSNPNHINGDYQPTQINIGSYQIYKNLKLFDIVENSLAVVTTNRRALMKELDELNYIFPSDLPKTKKGTTRAREKYYFCLKHPELIESVIQPKYISIKKYQEMEPLYHLIRSYLRRKYVDVIEFFEEFGVDVAHPAESNLDNQKDNKWNFPGDIVTEMLDKYGCNRCINYTPAKHIERRHFIHRRILINFDL